MAWPTHIVAAAGYVEDKDGNFLLVKTYHRGWDTAGGQIEVGENIEEGVLREILEESGITATVRYLMGVYFNVGQHLWYDDVTNVPTKVMFDFVCDYVGGQPTPSNETSEVIWVPKTEVMQYITAPAMRFRFEKMLTFNGKVSYCSYVTKPAFQVFINRTI
ncbi:MAG: NUDIX domain-containing protein [Oscillospiraceae bacterium]|jgi:8-oxo-dGTP pyrophosphatase MutT (NUDIX family)|nr:NUDIX domain-containing protein [Oscillospiraceae bacterium]